MIDGTSSACKMEESKEFNSFLKSESQQKSKLKRS